MHRVLLLITSAALLGATTGCVTGVCDCVDLPPPVIPPPAHIHPVAHSQPLSGGPLPAQVIPVPTTVPGGPEQIQVMPLPSATKSAPAPEVEKN